MYIWHDAHLAGSGPAVAQLIGLKKLPGSFHLNFPNYWIGHSLRLGCLHSVLDSNLLAEIWLFRGLLYKENMDKGVEKVMWSAVAPHLGASETIYFPNILLGFRSYLLNFGLENEVPMMSVHMTLILVICVKGLWWNFSTLAKKGEKLVRHLGLKNTPTKPLIEMWGFWFWPVVVWLTSLIQLFCFLFGFACPDVALEEQFK